MVAKNQWVGRNYIDDNPRMAVPPAFWLARLYDYDAELVVFPSRHVPFAYVLARRRRHGQRDIDKALATTLSQPDTKLCLERSLVPVSMIYQTGVNFNIDAIIRSLKARDIWAQGGTDKVVDKLDAQDNKEEQDKRDIVRDDMWARSGDAWASYKRRTGQRVSSPGLGSERQSPTSSFSGSTAGSGIVLAHG